MWFRDDFLFVKNNVVNYIILLQKTQRGDGGERGVVARVLLKQRAPAERGHIRRAQLSGWRPAAHRVLQAAAARAGHSSHSTQRRQACRCLAVSPNHNF